MEAKKIYTFKNIDLGIKTEAAKRRNRSILYLATEGGQKAKAGAKRFNLAKKLYNIIVDLNEAKELELYHDQFNTVAHEKAANRWSDYQIEQAPKAHAIAKKLNIKVYSGTWWHTMATNGRSISTDKF